MNADAIARDLLAHPDLSGALSGIDVELLATFNQGRAVLDGACERPVNRPRQVLKEAAPSNGAHPIPPAHARAAGLRGGRRIGYRGLHPGL